MGREKREEGRVLISWERKRVGEAPSAPQISPARAFDRDWQAVLQNRLEILNGKKIIRI
jgi:hypothetical protein